MSLRHNSDTFGFQHVLGIFRTTASFHVTDAKRNTHTPDFHCHILHPGNGSNTKYRRRRPLSRSQQSSIQGHHATYGVGKAQKTQRQLQGRHINW